ncbi:hypothetical protein HPP92_028056 [Vanilla planifolia]|uniref:Glycosyl transferase 64 domain-containing protein n=1 Tax=Vanilla planifolia TaxID=51239 RepID=A0A835P6X8_VANPL|nr:hypothetical protein HPP92_028056 [Vanilla planifolia]
MVSDSLPALPFSFDSALPPPPRKREAGVSEKFSISNVLSSKGTTSMRPGYHSLLPTSRRSPQKLRGLAFASPTAAAAAMKTLFSLCVALTLLLILARLASSVASLALLRHQRPMDSLFPASTLTPWKGFNILINTWKRNDLLLKSVQHYSKCGGVDSIHIVWSEPNPPSNSLHDGVNQAVHLNSKGSNNIEIIFDLNHEDSLNNRFKEIMDLKSDAIFSIDDDVILPCKSLEFAFSVWRSAPTTMVGFVPRMHWLDKSYRSSGDDEEILGGAPTGRVLRERVPIASAGGRN